VFQIRFPDFKLSCVKYDHGILTFLHRVCFTLFLRRFRVLNFSLSILAQTEFPENYR
jgi:hypothetical protein